MSKPRRKRKDEKLYVEWFDECKKRYIALAHGERAPLATRIGEAPDALAKMISGVKRIDGRIALELSRELGMDPPEWVVGRAGSKLLGTAWKLERSGVPAVIVERAADAFAAGTDKVSSGLDEIGRAAESSSLSGRTSK